ncbi:MAG TPA: helix-turn-helix domain-containing protein, partial [Baekduia sp.]|nr:helix-turn-helix domain-containing protein [Baekduia sp.]
DFARAELGRMAEPARRVAILRETLTEYFAQGGSTAATARALAIAERTVTYRLRRAEELIGRPVSERRADLETALRLYDVLDIV